MAKRGEGGKEILCAEGTAEHSDRRGRDDGSSDGGLDGLNWGREGDESAGSSGGWVDGCVVEERGGIGNMLPKKKDDLTQGSRDEGKTRSEGGVEVGVDMRQSRVEPFDGRQGTPDYGHVTGAEVSGGYGGLPAGKRSEGNVAHALRGNVSRRRPQLEGKEGVG